MPLTSLVSRFKNNALQAIILLNTYTEQDSKGWKYHKRNEHQKSARRFCKCVCHKLDCSRYRDVTLEPHLSWSKYYRLGNIVSFCHCFRRHLRMGRSTEEVGIMREAVI